MVVSDAKLAASRRNAQKSTGPRTEEGKRNSKLNAVTHGSRAETLILQCEDPQAFEDRSEAWSACLLPGNDVEQNAVDDAVEYSWLKDRARRAQTARLATNIRRNGHALRAQPSTAGEDLRRLNSHLKRARSDLLTIPGSADPSIAKPVVRADRLRCTDHEKTCIMMQTVTHACRSAMRVLSTLSFPPFHRRSRRGCPPLFLNRNSPGREEWWRCAPVREGC